MIDTLTGAGSIPAKQERTKEVEDCLLEAMRVRNLLYQISDDIEVSKLLNREWRDFFSDFFNCTIEALDEKYASFRDRFKDV